MITINKDHQISKTSSANLTQIELVYPPSWMSLWTETRVQIFMFLHIIKENIWLR